MKSEILITQIILCFALTQLAGCVSEVDTGGGDLLENQDSSIYYHYDREQLIGIGKMVDSNKVGYWKHFHENGVLKSEGNFSALGKEEGIWKYYNQEASLKFSKTFVDGKYEGLYIEFYESGNVFTEYVCVENKISGIYKEYFPNGQLKEQGEYVEGIGIIIEGPQKGDTVISLPVRTGEWNQFDSLGNSLENVEYLPIAEISFDTVDIMKDDSIVSQLVKNRYHYLIR